MEDVTYDNIKIHIFGKTTEGGGVKLTPPSPSLSSQVVLRLK